ELEGALVAGDGGEREAVAVLGGQRLRGAAQLRPGGRGLDPGVLEHLHVVEQGDGVDGGRDAVEGSVVHAGSATESVMPSVVMPYCSSGASAPDAATCWTLGLSSMSRSGRVREEPICRTFWINWSPGTRSREKVRPSSSAHWEKVPSIATSSAGVL